MTESTSRAAKRAASAQRIIEAARAEFGERGYEAATVRAIARRAGVDPSLVMQHYGSKSALFAIAADLGADSDAAEVSTHLADVLKLRLGGLPTETRALVRSMLTVPEATEAMRSFLDERVRNLARTDPDAGAQVRAAVAVSTILGLTIAKHFLELEALTGADDAEIEAVAQPLLDAMTRERAEGR